MDQRLTELALPERDDRARGPEPLLTQARARRNKAKVLIVMFFAVIFGALGDVSLRNGMKAVSDTALEGPLHAFATTMTNIYVIAGILLLVAFLLLYLASLSWEKLSFVLPLTAADYVLVTVLAHFLLHENISPIRWMGTLLVAIGIAMVART